MEMLVLTHKLFFVNGIEVGLEGLDAVGRLVWGTDNSDQHNRVE